MTKKAISQGSWAPGRTILLRPNIEYVAPTHLGSPWDHPVGRAVAAGGGAACLDDLLDRGDIFRGRADDREHDGQHCTHVDEIDGGRLVRNSTVNATFTLCETAE